MMSLTTQTNTNSAAESPATPRVTARNLLVLAIFVLTFHIPAVSRSVDMPLPEFHVNAADLPNFHVVHSYLYRGAAPSFAGLDDLKRMGVKTIIDLRRSADHIAVERSYATGLGINYINLPMGNSLPSKEKQERFISEVSKAAADQSQAPVFLHCSHGSDRTGYLTAVWRVQHDHWSILEAAAEMLRYGFVVHKLSPNPSERIDQ